MITLESAKLAFASWRAAKTNSNSPIPVKLWEMVDQLLLTHKQTKICTALGVSGHQIKSYYIAPTATKEQVLQPAPVIGTFVEATPATNVGIVELTLKGDSKSLHLCLPTAALREILPVLGALL